MRRSFSKVRPDSPQYSAACAVRIRVGLAAQNFAYDYIFRGRKASLFDPLYLEPYLGERLLYLLRRLLKIDITFKPI